MSFKCSNKICLSMLICRILRWFLLISRAWQWWFTVMIYVQLCHLAKSALHVLIHSLTKQDSWPWITPSNAVLIFLVSKIVNNGVHLKSLLPLISLFPCRYNIVASSTSVMTSICVPSRPWLGGNLAILKLLIMTSRQDLSWSSPLPRHTITSF